MEHNHHPSNLLLSALYWLFGQIAFIFSYITQYSTLEYAFKLLSIISVAMVIVINLKNFISALKSFSKNIRNWFK